MSLIVDGDEETPGSSVDQAEPLAGEAHGRGVHNR